MNGTTVAAATLTGAIALFLQADPHLSYSGAVATLSRYTLQYPDTFTLPLPNDTWGYGKLKLYKKVPDSPPPPSGDTHYVPEEG